MEIAILIISAVAVVLLATVLIIMLINKKNNLSQKEVQDICDEMQETITRDVTNAIETSSKLSNEITKNSNETIANLNKNFMESFDRRVDTLTKTTEESIRSLKTEVSASLDKTREITENKLEQLQNSNEKKLEEIRKTVDDKLTETLDKRLEASFKSIVDTIQAVQKNFGEMTKLSEQVNELNKTFSNVKTRGTWGEVSLEGLLSEIMSPNQYEKQKTIQKGCIVDFVIKMPGKTEKDSTYLPIDSKFPIESYKRLVDASENGSKEDEIREKNELAKAVKEQAKSICQKYIKIPMTTDFAIMYLPTEGLYSEVVRNDDLITEMRNKFKVIPCGPSVLSAILNSLQVGFLTLKIQKNSGEVAKMLKTFQVDFSKFTKIIEDTKKEAQKVVESLGKADERNNYIKSRLEKVDNLKLTSLDSELIEIEGNTSEQ